MVAVAFVGGRREVEVSVVHKERVKTGAIT